MNILGFIPIINKDKIDIENIEKIYNEISNCKLITKTYIITDNLEFYNKCKKIGNVHLLKNKYITDLDSIFNTIKKSKKINGFVYVNINEVFIKTKHINDVCLGLQHENSITTLKYITNKTRYHNNAFCTKSDKLLFLNNSIISQFVNIDVYAINLNDNKIKNLICRNNNTIINFIFNEVDIYSYTTKIPTLYLTNELNNTEIYNFSILQNNLLQKYY